MADRIILWTACRRGRKGYVNAHLAGQEIDLADYCQSTYGEPRPTLDWGPMADRDDIDRLAAAVIITCGCPNLAALDMGAGLASALAIAPDEWSIRREELRGWVRAAPMLAMFQSWLPGVTPLMSPMQAARPSRD